MQREAMVLTAPEETYSRKRTRKRGLEAALDRDPVEDFAEPGEVDGGYNSGRRRTGLRLTFRGGLPTSLWGRIATGVALLCVAGFVVAVFAMAQRVLLHDQRFVLAGAASVQIEGAQHLTRGQLLPVFAGDLERNLFNVSLSDRKAELEQIPWVKHATVMRLLPDRLRISIEERTPVAFVRQGNHINLVDASGVLLDMKSGSGERSSYSFPVVTGINANDPASVREARMKIFGEFTRDLDSAGARISAKLSEVDLSNPEDVKALIPDNGAEVLVHFGEGNFLDRYNKYEAHLAEWRTQYPNLSSVDMRYERQVVLEMQPGTAVPLAGSSAAAVAPVTQAALLKHAGGPRLITAPKTPLPARHVVAVHAAPAHPTAKHPTAKAHKSQVGHR